MKKRNKFSKFGSSLERKIAKLLKKYKISYVRQYRINEYSFDFYIIDLNLLIEVMGTYWHGDTRIYRKLNKNQYLNKRRDERKRILAEKKGYRVLYLWEYDIINFPKEIENIISNLYKRKAK